MTSLDWNLVLLVAGAFAAPIAFLALLRDYFDIKHNPGSRLGHGIFRFIRAALRHLGNFTAQLLMLTIKTIVVVSTSVISFLSIMAIYGAVTANADLAESTHPPAVKPPKKIEDTEETSSTEVIAETGISESDPCTLVPTKSRDEWRERFIRKFSKDSYHVIVASLYAPKDAPHGGDWYKSVGLREVARIERKYTEFAFRGFFAVPEVQTSRQFAIAMGIGLSLEEANLVLQFARNCVTEDAYILQETVSKTVYK